MCTCWCPASMRLLGCFFPTQPSPLKSSWTNLLTEAEIYLGIKGQVPHQFWCWQSCHLPPGTHSRRALAPCFHAPSTWVEALTVKQDSSQVSFHFPHWKKVPEESWSCRKGLKADSAALSNVLKFATGSLRQPVHLMGFHGVPSFRSFVFPGCLWMFDFAIWNSLGSRVPRSQPLQYQNPFGISPKQHA